MLENPKMYQDDRDKVSFVPTLPPELEEAKRAGFIAMNPVQEEEDDDQGDTEVRLVGMAPRVNEWLVLKIRNVA